MSFRIDPSKPLGAEFVRIAQGELEAAIAGLHPAHPDIHEGIHEARQRFKRLRGLLRLVRFGIGPAYAAENAFLRDCARSLSGLRDMTAMIETVDNLAAHLGPAGAPASLARLRAELVAERDRRAAGDLGLEAACAAAREACAEALERFSDIAVRSGAERAARIVAKGWTANFARARTALDLSRDGGGDADFHDLRKRVKYHMMHARLLQPLWPSAMKVRRNAAKALAATLGDDHDLCVLSTWLEAARPRLADVAEPSLIERLVNDRKAERRAEALAVAGDLLADPPATAKDRVARLYRAAAR